MEILKLIFSASGATIVVCATILVVIGSTVAFRRRLGGSSLKLGEKFVLSFDRVDTAPAKLPALSVESDQDASAIAATTQELKQKVDFLELIDAMGKHDTAAVEKFFDALKQEDNDNFSVLELEAWRQFSLLRLGVTDALKRLEQMEIDNPDDFSASRHLASYYMLIKEPRIARVHAEKYLSRSTNDNERVGAIILISEAIQADSGVTGALKYLSEGLQNIRDARSTSMLCEKIGLLYRDMGQPNHAIVALSQAVAADIHNVSARFYLANIAGDIDDFKLLALKHFNTLVLQQTDNDGARNNFGVLCEKMDYPIKKIALWRKAAEAGEGFAYGNLIFALIDTGFESEARQRIQNIPDALRSHDRVISAISHVSNAVTIEEEAITKKLEFAERICSHLNFNLKEAVFDPSFILGTWINKKGESFGISVVGSRYRIALTRNHETMYGSTEHATGFFHTTLSVESKSGGSTSLLGGIATYRGEIYCLTQRDLVRVVHVMGHNIEVIEFDAREGNAP